MDFESSKPLYIKIADDIQCQIVNGQLRSNEKLPTEKYFSDYYKVSRITVRKALEELLARGLIERKKNKGCFIRSRKPESAHGLKNSIYKALEEKGVSVTSQITKMEVLEASADLAEKLKCQKEEKVLLIERIRLGNGKPFAIQRVWLLERLFPEFNPWKLCNDSLRRIMNEDYGMKLVYSVEEIEARMPTKEVAYHLKVSEDTPLIFITSHIYTADQMIAEYSETYYDTEEYAYTVSQDR